MKITFPFKVKSQEHWNKIWPELKNQGYKWADGDELNSFFSDCHDFPQYIEEDVYNTSELIINDEL